MSEAELEKMKQEVGNNLLDWDRFLEFAARKPRDQQQQQERLINAFRVFDKNDTGSVDADELKHILTSIGEKLTAQEFSDILDTAGISAQGRINYREFVS